MLRINNNNKKWFFGKKVKCSFGNGIISRVEKFTVEILLDKPTWVFGTFSYRCTEYKRNIKTL